MARAFSPSTKGILHGCPVQRLVSTHMCIYTGRYLRMGRQAQGRRIRCRGRRSSRELFPWRSRSASPTSPPATTTGIKITFELLKRGKNHRRFGGGKKIQKGAATAGKGATSISLSDSSSIIVHEFGTSIGVFPTEG